MTRSRRAGSAPACGSWGGPRAPGPRPAPPRGGRPRPGRPRGGSRGTRSAGTGRTWRAMRAAQVPLRQARGDHGPRQRPPGAGPDRRAPTPARRVPGDPMAARRPRAALDAQPHRHARARRRQRGGRRYSYAYRATTCPRPGSTRPRPGRPRPARPRRPRPRTPPACAGRPPGRLAPTAPIASPTPASRAHRPTAVCDTPSSRAAAHADQPSAINSIARRRTSPGDPHPARHINHSSEPVMVQPSPDTKQFQPSFSEAKCTSRVQNAYLDREGTRAGRRVSAGGRRGRAGPGPLTRWCAARSGPP